MAYLTAGLLLAPIMLDPLCRVSSSAQGIYSLMSNITSFTSYPNIIVALKELDLEASVRVLEKLLKEIIIKNKTKTLDENLSLLKKCISDIEKELIIVHEKLAYNSGVSYFKYFRTYKFTTSIERLRVLKSQLENRKHMLFDILRINSELKLYVSPSFDPEVSLIDND
jgi:hypothetical protein